MKPAGSRPTSIRVHTRNATWFASSAAALLLTFTPAPAKATAPAIAQTQWADAVHARLAAQAFETSDASASVPMTAVNMPVSSRAHPVTAWARAVEARLAQHAHRVANAGRSALAWSERGVASWYGADHLGRLTSSGERFNPMQLTCAHPTLPLGTKVLVTSETTGRSVIVTVNDRGPYGNRIVDLSHAAAARIGMLGSGTASVTLQQATADVIEVAQAADGDTSDQAIDVADQGAATMVSPQRRGLQHRRLAAR